MNARQLIEYKENLQVAVYFETQIHTELIATFCDEELYMLMLPELVKYAKKHKGIITESLSQDN